MRSIQLIIIALMFLVGPAKAQIYEVRNGTVHFHSDAPKELISARSVGLQGLIDAGRKAFAFRIRMVSFNGFNSSLQQVHFNENYMESSRFPEAVFTGKIIEDDDITRDGTHNIRAKGKLHIHGLEQERIIKAQVTTKKGVMNIVSDFSISLADYDIKIPRVVYDKLAPEIRVSVNASLQPRL